MPPPPCSVSRCARPTFNIKRNLCKLHYHRLMRFGSTGQPEQARRPRGTCTAPDCGKPTEARGLCSAHYSRVRRAENGATPDGDPMRPVGTPGRPARRRGPVRRPNGYVYVGGKAEHRIIMEGMLGRPLEPGEEVHHRNGQRDDNRPENLELWLVGSQPKGQRVVDLLAWAQEITRKYGDITI